MLIQKLSNMKSADIPSLMMDGLHIKIEPALVEEFHNVREFRNKIVHGDSVELSIKQVTNMSKLLRKLSLCLD